MSALLTERKKYGGVKFLDLEGCTIPDISASKKYRVFSWLTGVKKISLRAARIHPESFKIIVD